MRSPFQLILNNVLEKIPLNTAETDFFCSLLECKMIPRKHFLLSNSGVCRNEYFVNRGCLRTFSIDEAGAEHTGMFAIEGWYTGDLYSFMTGAPSTLNIAAMEDTEVLQLSKTNWDLLLEKIPAFEKLYRLKFQNAFIALQQRMMQNLSLTAEERYTIFIKSYPSIEQRVPQKYIASYLGITPEFLSMIRKKVIEKDFLK